LAVIVGLASAARAGAQSTGTWLDGPPPVWNVPGAPVPVAPPAEVPFQPQCLAQEHGPSTPEEARLAAAGWRLERYWPVQVRGDVTLVVALSSYDGMCRPWGFNAFVFAGGSFAGTLSPQPMHARFDGVLDRGPTVLTSGEIEATFRRYAPPDPLCCPSRPPARVVYHLVRRGGVPVVVLSQIGPAGPTPLPRTGEGAAGWAAASLAAAAAAAGGFVRRPRRRSVARTMPSAASATPWASRW
jgi:hypothetical protein